MTCSTTIHSHVGATKLNCTWLTRLLTNQCLNKLKAGKAKSNLHLCGLKRRRRHLLPFNTHVAKQWSSKPPITTTEPCGKNNLILVSSVHGAVVFSFILLPQISRVPGAKANWCFGKYRYVRRLLDVISDKLNIELKKNHQCFLLPDRNFSKQRFGANFCIMK